VGPAIEVDRRGALTHEIRERCELRVVSETLRVALALVAERDALGGREPRVGALFQQHLEIVVR
jgi:hypothetical protein